MHIHTCVYTHERQAEKYRNSFDGDQYKCSINCHSVLLFTVSKVFYIRVARARETAQTCSCSHMYKRRKSWRRQASCSVGTYVVRVEKQSKAKRETKRKESNREKPETRRPQCVRALCMLVISFVFIEIVCILAL